MRIHDPSRFSPEFLAKVAEKVGEVEKERRKHERWVALHGDITPPVSIVWNGARLVGAGGTIYKSGPDSSWYGFLYDHLQTVMGVEWFATEAHKSEGERHVLVQWFKLVCDREFREDGRFDPHPPMPDTGATLAFRSVAYDLWCMAQNNKLEPALLARLRHPDQFEGARYKLWVAACFLPAGFELEFEDERDRRRTHCEFVATDKRSGAKFSVEAKRRHRDLDHEKVRREGTNPKLDVTRPLADALKKKADHQRMIFVDVNMPPHNGIILNAPWMKQLKASKEVLERQPHYRDRPDLAAFIMATNHPYHSVASVMPDAKTHFIGGFFNMPDLDENEQEFPQRHPVVIRLMQSIDAHFQIPEDMF